MSNLIMDKKSLEEGYWMCQHGIVDYASTWFGKPPDICSWILAHHLPNANIDDGECAPWTPLTIQERRTT